jgi:membrane-bound lytic murein transglycosylase D
VKAGETLDSIAAALHAKVPDIARTNGITTQDPMSVDDELVVPVVSVTGIASPQRYTVRAGDTLVTVADRFNVSIEELRKWNALSTSSVKPGRVLYVAEPVRLAPSVRARARVANGPAKKSATHSSTGKGKAPAKAPAKTAGQSAKQSHVAPAKAKAAPAKPNTAK